MPQLLDHTGTPIASTRPTSNVRAMARTREYKDRFQKFLRASYDAAQTTDDNERHWANADYLSANASQRWGIRRRLRSRARYEAQENNSYAKGMLLTLANDIIGTGPRLQLMTSDKTANRRVQNSFDDWSREIRLAEKARTGVMAEVVDGESYGLFTTNPKISHDVKLDYRLIEADQFDIPWEFTAKLETEEFEGIRFDPFGNPTEYWMLKQHPGSLYNITFYDGDWIDAAHVVHLFRQDRPGQTRGATQLATALPLFAMLRRFTLATLAAAETAASFAAVMQTNTSAQVDAAEFQEDEWFEAIPLEYRAMLTLPQGWSLNQLRAEHPTTTYGMFKQELINEIARCLNMPYNVAAANSSNYNYASGRMDHQVYFKSIGISQHQRECALLDRLFIAWCNEAMFIPGLLPESAGPIRTWKWQWFWDRPDPVDPEKAAKAQALQIASGTTHRAREYQRQGLDIDVEDQTAADSYGVDIATYRQMLLQKHMAAGGQPGGDTVDSPDPAEQEQE